MLLTRAIDIRGDLARTIKEVYSEDVCFARTLDQHIERMRKLVWETPRYKMLPSHAKSYLHGVDKTLWDMLYSVPLTYHTIDNVLPSPLVSIVIGPDGRQFGPGNDTWLNESREYKEAMKIQHVWEHRWRKGEYKPW
jgi:hypothetical protein